MTARPSDLDGPAGERRAPSLTPAARAYLADVSRAAVVDMSEPRPIAAAGTRASWGSAAAEVSL